MSINISSHVHVNENTPVRIIGNCIEFGDGIPGITLYMKPELQLQLALLIVEHHKSNAVQATEEARGAA